MKKIIRKGLIIKMAMVLISALFVVLLMTKMSTASELVFYVYPSGDTSGETDAANIMAAFDQAKTAGDGSIVQLDAGTFHINRTIEPWDFVGTFKGAGKGVTTIKVTPTGFSASGLQPFSTLFAFYLKGRGASVEDTVNLTIKGMTLVLTGEAPALYLPDWKPDPIYNWYGIFIDARYEVIETDPGVKEITALESYRNVTCSDISIIADAAIHRCADPLVIAGGQGGTVIDNIFYRNFVYGRNTGTIKVSNVDMITNNGFSKLMICDQYDSTVTVERVTFEGTGELGTYLSYMGNNTAINVSHLKTTVCSGVAFFDNESCTLSVSHCDINQAVDAVWAGIEIWDDGSNNILISQNKFHSEDSFLWGPIFAEGVQNGVITNNKITGKGSAAIYLGVYDWLPGSFTLVGNNLQNWENTGLNPWWINAAAIWLGPYITDSVVVGGNNKVNIFDEPEYDYSYPDWWNHPLPPDAYGNAQTYDKNGNIVPKNNIFTGVNNMHLNIGQDVRDAMKQKVEAKKAMMSRGGELR